MRRIREVMRLKFQLGLNDTQVARGARLSRSTVQDYLRRIAATGADHEQLLALGDAELDQRLFPPRQASGARGALPDWENIERELRGKGVTLRLLWQEYLEVTLGGYQYTQFARLFRNWRETCRPPAMRQVHRAGAALEVDYAGMTLSIIDMGQRREAQIFVACLPCSQLIYAEASCIARQSGWDSASIRTGHCNRNGNNTVLFDCR